MFMSHHQNAGQNNMMEAASGSFENVALVKCFGTTILNQSYAYK